MNPESIEDSIYQQSVVVALRCETKKKCMNEEELVSADASWCWCWYYRPGFSCVEDRHGGAPKRNRRLPLRKDYSPHGFERISQHKRNRARKCNKQGAFCKGAIDIIIIHDNQILKRDREARTTYW
jgi:hypothetical protein